ncbi:unnamed protein product [Moneuplotes crassus]|uniref:Enoyl-CoA hydratase/isomerase family protein n=1 Tax=Euplotes crassus TaxID=5936 RepID=A0AAD1XVH9_EUPCR|nr:unnamed protein product [Moneuplotes crassus]
MSRLKAAIDKTIKSKTPVGVIKEGNLNIVVMNSNDNRLNPTFCAHLHEAMDEVEQQEDVRGQVLVTVSTHPKIFSNGVDIEKLHTKDQVLETLSGLNRFLLRMLKSRIPTIGCVNGHAFAGGWFLAMAHHYRIMNADRGWICLNEIDLNVPIPKAFNAFGVQKLGEHNYCEASCIGYRYAAQEAFQKGIATQIYPDKDVLAMTEDFADSLSAKNLDPVAFQLMSEDIYKTAIENLENPQNIDLTAEKIAEYK